MRYALRFILLLTFPFMALAQQPLPEQSLTDRVQEARAKHLFHALRCEVCQGQSVGDSQAPLAQDMRMLVREKVAAGEQDDAILRYLSTRYGEHILMRPPLSAHTAPLWLAPLVIACIGLFVIARYFKKRTP